jgi:hypothetical protein
LCEHGRAQGCFLRLITQLQRDQIGPAPFDALFAVADLFGVQRRQIDSPIQPNRYIG